MSPRMTLNSWGSSSMLVRRSQDPSRVTRRSPSSLYSHLRLDVLGQQPQDVVPVHGLVTALAHGAELVHREGLLVQAHPGLPEEPAPGLVARTAT